MDDGTLPVNPPAIGDAAPGNPPAAPIELKFVFEKETPNTIRFKEQVAAETDKPVVGSLYVRKDVAGDRKELTVTIS